MLPPVWLAWRPCISEFNIATYCSKSTFFENNQPSSLQTYQLHKFSVTYSNNITLLLHLYIAVLPALLTYEEKKVCTDDIAGSTA